MATLGPTDMDERPDILILEDDPTDAELIRRELRKAGLDFTSRWVQDKDGFLQTLDGAAPALVLVDYSVPGFDGLTALRLAKERCGDIPVIVVSGAIGEETAVEALKAGATDYVLKQRLGRLGPVALRALQEGRQAKESRRVAQEAKQAAEKLRQVAAELQEANVTLRESRIAALNLMKDAVEARQQAEQAAINLARQTDELRDSNEELARFNRAAVDRELRMVELKKQVNELCAKAGLPPAYKMEFGEKEASQ